MAAFFRYCRGHEDEEAVNVEREISFVFRLDGARATPALCAAAADAKHQSPFPTIDLPASLCELVLGLPRAAPAMGGDWSILKTIAQGGDSFKVVRV